MLRVGRGIRLYAVKANYVYLICVVWSGQHKWDLILPNRKNNATVTTTAPDQTASMMKAYSLAPFEAGYFTTFNLISTICMTLISFGDSPQYFRHQLLSNVIRWSTRIAYDFFARRLCAHNFISVPDTRRAFALKPIYALNQSIEMTPFNLDTLSLNVQLLAIIAK